jgi:hypothetical protein
MILGYFHNLGKDSSGVAVNLKIQLHFIKLNQL